MNRTPIPPFVRLGLRAFMRDWRAGELRVLFFALTIAVAAIASVGLLSDRAAQALDRDAAQMLGGDLVIRSGQPIPRDFEAEAHLRGLNVSRTVQFPSMAMHGEAATLVSLKAVDGAYPLRGGLHVATAIAADEMTKASAPPRRSVWVDEQLLAMLTVEMGDLIDVGDLRLEVAGVIRHEPDRGTQFINLAPRLMMNLADLPAANLLGPGSRVQHHLLVAGETSAIRTFREWLEPQLVRGQRLTTLEDSRPEVMRLLERAERFLFLVALLSTLIAAIAVALAARQYTRRHTDSVAVLRCLGVSGRVLIGALWVQFILVALVGSTIGIALGFLAHQGLLAILAGWLDTELPFPTYRPVIQSWLSGFLLLLGFALPPLAALRHVPPARALRRDAAMGRHRRWPAYLIAAIAFLVLISWTSGNLATSLALVLGFVTAFVVFALAGTLLIRVLQRLSGLKRDSVSWRFALAGMVRRRGLTLTQICALSLGIMLLLMLGILRNDLLRSWEQSLPSDAPNTFLINIQADQRGNVLSLISSVGLSEPILYPMVRGRLVAINGLAVHPDQYTDERAQRLIDREFNLSVAEALPPSNEMVAGQWLDPNAFEMTLEEGFAASLGIAVGDVLQFDVAGRPVTVTVSGLRKVRWDSFEVNFFALLSPASLSGAPATYITSLHIPDSSSEIKKALVHTLPNITVFDVGVILAQLRLMLERSMTSIQWLFGFTLLAGVVVLGAALHASREERMHEVAIMRALGARAHLLRGALMRELLICGVIAGLLAATASIVLARVLADQVLEVQLVSVWWPWPAGVAVGVMAALLGGRFALSGVLRASPLSTLREVT